MKHVVSPFYGIAAALFGLNAPSASAQALITQIEGCDFASGEIHAACIPIFLAHIIEFIFGFAGAVCLIMIIYSGYEIAISSLGGGDRSAGLNRLKFAIIGFVVSALAIFIIDFIISTIAGIA